jgi:hypothetical protein
MPINFPNSPSPSQLYSYDNKTWEWNGIYWEVYSGLTSYVSGAGTTNYVPKWTGSTGLGDSLIYDNGGFVGIGTSSQTYQEVLSVAGGDGGIVNNLFNFVGHSSGSIAIADANYRPWTSNGNEIAIGGGQPLLNSEGSYNIAIGSSALQTNVTGVNNIAIGDSSLLSNQAGQYNVSIGSGAGTNVTSGSFNVLIGPSAGVNLTTEENKLYIANNASTPLIYGEFDNGFVGINTTTPIAALDVSGNTRIDGTISATTYYNLPGSSSANCFTTFYVTNISGCSPVNMLSPLNVQDGLSVTGTSTFTSLANFTGGLSANTFSAGTYQNLPVSAVTSGTGISTSTSNGNVTITNSDRGSSQNIFKNIQAGGVTQFSAGSNSSDLNFSGINITITSAATNTLVFSAGTGGGGGVTSLTTGTGLSGNSTTGAVSLQLSASSYSMFVNNTASAAAPTQVTYKDTGDASFSSNVTWGTSTPSPNTGNYRYRWTQVGNTVNFYFIWTIVAGGGAGQSPIIITLPNDMPQPAVPTGFNVASYILQRFQFNGNNAIGGTGATNTLSFANLQRNSGNTAYDLIYPSSTILRWFSITGQYFV